MPTHHIDHDFLYCLCSSTAQLHGTYAARLRLGSPVAAPEYSSLTPLLTFPQFPSHRPRSQALSKIACNRLMGPSLSPPVSPHGAPSIPKERSDASDPSPLAATTCQHPLLLVLRFQDFWFKSNPILFQRQACKIAEQADFFSFGTNDLTQMTFGYSRDDVCKFLPIYLSKDILQKDPFESGRNFATEAKSTEAPKIAEQADFFSFGTNDLTQMTFGYSRDDVGKFLPIYLSKGILHKDPFEAVCIDLDVLLLVEREELCDRGEIN